LKSRADHAIGLGIILVLSGPLLGQRPSFGLANHWLLAVAGATEPATVPNGNKTDNDSYVIGNDDVLGINVWKEPDFTRSIQVRSDGKISLPLLGEVQAAGRTPLQLQQEIATKLLNYMTKPEVTVMVEQINSKKFNILGQVVKPGSYSLALAPTVVDAIAIAGGPRDFAKEKSIYILRQNASGGQTRIVFNYKEFIKGKSTNGKNSNQNVTLEPHDTIVVP
jgi:polysaccharide export outer membrane protein